MLPMSPDQVAASVVAVERRIVAACDRVGRRRESVTLVAVSKTFGADAASAAIAAGVTDLGENRVQEAKDKIGAVTGSARWHLIGHLQSNKARDAVKLFDVIQTVDSLDLARRIARFAQADGKRQDVMIEVNVGREPQKAGIDPTDLEPVVRSITAIDALNVRGLMAIPPLGEPEDVRRYFRELRVLRDGMGLTELSMGMTDDFEVAIEEGSTLIRVGRAIFGSRG
jgi:pyridoxal phosphate enzyme (YggS family)